MPTLQPHHPMPTMRTPDSTASSALPHPYAHQNPFDSRRATLALLALLALVFSSPYAIPVFWLHLAQWLKFVPSDNPGLLPSPSINQTWYVTFGAIAVFLPMAFTRLLSPLPRPDRFLAVSAFGWFLASAISCVFTPGILWSYSDLFLLGSFLLIFSTAVTTRPTAPQIAKLCLFGAITTAPIAIIACAQNAGYDPFPYSTTMPGSLNTVEGKHLVASLFGHPNYMGSYLAPLIALMLPICFSGRNVVVRFSISSAAVLSFYALVIGGTRGPLLALVCGFTVYLAMLPRRNFGFKKLALVLGGAAVVLLIAAALIPALQPGFEITDRILGSKEIASRAFYWRVGLYTFAENPIIGIGPGQFDKLFWHNVLKTPGIEPGEPWHFVLASIIRGVRPGQMHNDHLQVLVESGVLGAIFWAALWTTIVRKGVGLRRTVISSVDASFNAALVAAFSVFFVDALFNFPLHLPCSGALFWLLLGVYTVWKPQIRHSDRL